MIKSRSDITHQAHQEERHLQHRVRNEVETSYKLVIPGSRLKINKVRRRPEDYLDHYNLEKHPN